MDNQISHKKERSRERILFDPEISYTKAQRILREELLRED